MMRVPRALYVAMLCLAFARRPLEAQRTEPAALTLRAGRPAGVASERLHPVVRSASRDSLSASRRRATVIGGVVGAVAGGLAGTVIGLNQNAYGCIDFGPSCPHKKGHTALYASAGLAVGGLLGAVIGHSLGMFGR